MNSLGFYRKVFLATSFFLLFPFACKSQALSDSLLRVLDNTIAKKGIYVQAKLARIQALQRQLTSVPKINTLQQFDVYNKLFHEYKVFIYDSAFKYCGKLSQTAFQLRDPMKINYARLKRCFILLSSGMYKETFDSLKTIRMAVLPDSSKIDYYLQVARAYLDLGIYDADQFYYRIHTTQGLQFLDSALIYCKPNSYDYFYLSNYKHMTQGNIEEALAEVNYLLKNITLTLHQRAINNHHLGSMYLRKGESSKALNAFLVASICDIQACVKENAALNSVADLLHKKGEVKKAHALIEEAMKDALYYGAHQRKIEISSVLPIIADRELRAVESERRVLLTYSTALTALGILLITFLIIIAKQVKKLQAAEASIKKANVDLQEINHQLREADKIKEEYIGYYFNINSTYLTKIEEVLKAIDQKLTAKKFDDIRFILTNINLKHEREQLFVNFDKVFLNLFPDFVTIFNSHFKDEDKIVLKENQLLNTELRIFALIRLGINDTEKIAKILDYSVNTIYTYKTKVKSKSLLPNEEFEKKIMSIRTV